MEKLLVMLPGLRARDRSQYRWMKDWGLVALPVHSDQ